MRKTWKQISLEVINKAYPVVVKNNPSMNTDGIMKIISREHYPFFERENFPYQAWLKAIKEFKTRLKNQPLFDAVEAKEKDSERGLLEFV